MRKMYFRGKWGQNDPCHFNIGFLFFTYLSICINMLLLHNHKQQNISRPNFGLSLKTFCLYCLLLILFVLCVIIMHTGHISHVMQHNESSTKGGMRSLYGPRPLRLYTYLFLFLLDNLLYPKSPQFNIYKGWWRPQRILHRARVCMARKSGDFIMVYKKIPYQAPLTQLGPRKCTFWKNAFLGPKYEC